LGNGVGSIRRFLDDFERVSRRQPAQITPARRYSWVVGTAVESCFAPVVARCNQIEGLELQMRAIPSRFWGQQITVTGLLTGQDLLEALGDQDLGDALVLPGLMLKEGKEFLDGLTVTELSQRLRVPVVIVNGGGKALLDVLTQPPVESCDFES